MSSMDFKEKFVMFWKSDQGKIPILRDIVIVLMVVAVLMSVLWGVTGQPFPQPPLVVIESGSMMHDDAGFGKVGTIDPGDLVFVMAVDSRGDVMTAASRRAEAIQYRTYGYFGDVLIYHPDKTGDGSIDDPQDKLETPIIHRAMGWVAYNASADTYRVQEYGIKDEPSITISELGLSNYQPESSGFITKGDNNNVCDQVSNICPLPVKVDWIIGKAAGEIPWFGLIKLALFGNPGAIPDNGWITIGFATAPADCWIMLGVSLSILISVPVTLDVYDYYERKKKRF